MSIWPRIYHGRVCVPWWYGLGYCAWVVVIAYLIGISRSDTMDIYLSMESLIALVICAFIGALFYTVFGALSRYEKQRTDAEKIRNAVAASGRDPTAEDQLTASEKWELKKACKFDRLFLVADIFQVIIGTGIAVAILFLFGGSVIEDQFAKYGVLGFVAGIIVTLIIYETLVKTAVAGLWEKKSAEAFRVITTVADEVVEANGGLQTLIDKYTAAGLSKREAREMAKAKLIEDPDYLNKL